MKRPTLDMSTEQTDDATVLTVQGRVDIENSPQLRDALQQLIKRGTAIILVDLEHADRVDTSVLATLVESALRISQTGGRLLVAGLENEGEHDFTLEQTKGTFERYQTRDDALADLG